MKVTVKKPCEVCHKLFTFTVNRCDLRAWKKGVVIQDAMPYLPPAERELLISGICGNCFSELFQEEGEML